MNRSHQTFLAACLAFVCLGSHAQSAPSSAEGAPSRGDLILSLMLDRGLVPTQAAQHGIEVARQVRDQASELVIASLNFIGVRYRMGGNSADEGFDCSGFVRHMVQSTVGLVLPRRADEQARSASVFPISPDDLQPGDLVFFNTLRRAFSHVGIYVGDGKFIHSPRTGSSVRVEDMGKDYWTTRFNGARRVFAVHGGSEPDRPALR